MAQADICCRECGHVITDEAPNADLAQRKPCPQCGALTRITSTSGEICITFDMTGSLELITYPQKLLATCKGFIEGGQYDMSVVVAHMACEIATERTLSAAFTSQGIQHLKGPILDFLNGYSLANDRTRKFYTALTGDHIEQQSFWLAFKESAARRNKIIHSGSVISQAEAQSSYEAASDFVSHLKE